MWGPHRTPMFMVHHLEHDGASAVRCSSVVLVSAGAMCVKVLRRAFCAWRNNCHTNPSWHLRQGDGSTQLCFTNLRPNYQKCCRAQRARNSRLSLFRHFLKLTKTVPPWLSLTLLEPPDKRLGICHTPLEQSHTFANNTFCLWCFLNPTLGWK